MTKTSTLGVQLAGWPAQRDQRIQLDEDFALRRAVEHCAYFRRRARAAAAAETLQMLGFDVQLRRSGLRTALQATRDEALDEASVTRFLTLVVSVVELERGSYDGWGAAVAARGPARDTVA